MGAAGGFNDVVRDYGHFVDLHGSLDLREQPAQEAEIAAGNPGDCRDRLYAGEICVIEFDAKRAPMACQNEGQFVAAQWPVIVRKSDAAIN